MFGSYLPQLTELQTALSLRSPQSNTDFQLNTDDPGIIEHNNYTVDIQSALLKATVTHLESHAIRAQ